MVHRARERVQYADHLLFEPTNGDEAGAVNGVDLVQGHNLRCSCDPSRSACDQVQYKYPHVLGRAEQRLVKVVSLPAVVTHCVFSLLFVGSYKRFCG